MPKAGMITSTSRAGGRSTIQHYRNCRIIERNAGDTRADEGIINVSGRQAGAVANPAALSYYRPKPVANASGDPIPALLGSSAAFQVRSEQKKSRYQPILGDEVDTTFMRFVAFIVEATGRLSGDALRLVKLACMDSKTTTIIHQFCIQVGGAIARYNAMAALA